MKKIAVITLTFFALAACGKSKSGKQIAEEVCECSKKANALPVSDPGREQAQKDCNAKNTEAWNKVKEDIEKADEFNKTISKCAEEQIKKSFGQ